MASELFFFFLFSYFVLQHMEEQVWCASADCWETEFSTEHHNTVARP